jgi:hypothetical protein
MYIYMYYIFYIIYFILYIIYIEIRFKIKSCEIPLIFQLPPVAASGAPLRPGSMISSSSDDLASKSWRIGIRNGDKMGSVPWNIGIYSWFTVYIYYVDLYLESCYISTETVGFMVDISVARWSCRQNGLHPRNRKWLPSHTLLRYIRFMSRLKCCSYLPTTVFVGYTSK